MAIQVKNDNVLIGHINELENAVDSLDSRLDVVEDKFSEYLPLTGGGLTGPLTSISSLALGNSLTFNGVYNAIRYVGTSSTNSMIRFLDNASNGNGTGVSIGGGGATIIGGGESALIMEGALSANDQEVLYLCNDGNIDFYTKCQDGSGSAVHTYIDTNGNFSGNSATASALNGFHLSGTISTDLDTVKTPGFYRLNPTCANAPSDYSYGQMLVTYGGADTISQMIFPYGTSELWLRNGNTVNNSGGTWKPWTHIGNAAYAYNNAWNISSSTGELTTSLSITTHGRPVFIAFSWDMQGTAAGQWCTGAVYRGSTQLKARTTVCAASSYNESGVITYLDVVGAGSYTYNFKLKVGSGTITYNEANLYGNEQPSLCVFEI